MYLEIIQHGQHTHQHALDRQQMNTSHNSLHVEILSSSREEDHIAVMLGDLFHHSGEVRLCLENCGKDLVKVSCQHSLDVFWGIGWSRFCDGFDFILMKLCNLLGLILLKITHRDQNESSSPHDAIHEQDGDRLGHTRGVETVR